MGEGCSRIRYMSGEDVGVLMTKCQYAKSRNTNRLETFGERWEGSTDDVGCKAISEIWGSKGRREGRGNGGKKDEDDRQKGGERREKEKGRDKKGLRKEGGNDEKERG